MLVRARIPVDFYITAPREEDLRLRASFYYRKLLCRIAVTGSDILKFKEESGEVAVLHAGKLDIVLEESKANDYFEGIIEGGKFSELVSIITRSTNRFLEAIRIFGMVPHIHDILEDYPRAECTLFFWSVQYSCDGDIWNPIIDRPRDYEHLMRYFSYKQSPAGRLDAKKWPEIQRALEDNLTPPPEREFITNSIENLQIKNYRMALLESIIGLEIILARYLNEYLANKKGLSKTRIKDLVSPGLDLTARVSVILTLIIEPEYLESIDIEKILSAINWRNSVIHKTGNIPHGVTEEALKESINEVLSLIDLLGYLYEKNA